MRTRVLAALAACVLAAVPTWAQLGETPKTISTLDVSTSTSTLLVFANGTVTPDNTATQEELPGLGHKFERSRTATCRRGPRSPLSIINSA